MRDRHAQARMAELFRSSKQATGYLRRNILESRELDRGATVKEILTVQKEDGRKVSRALEFYNLDADIAVGYRVNSFEATQFRIWATRTLRDFMVKRSVLDDERLKQGKRFGPDYFEVLLDRIRSIGASGRRRIRLNGSSSSTYQTNPKKSQTGMARKSKKTAQRRLPQASEVNTS
jgi:hypothetical protein